MTAPADGGARAICTCAVPDPVMQADRRFYCYTCSLPRPAQLCDRCQAIVIAEAPAPAAIPAETTTDQQIIAALQREIDAAEHNRLMAVGVGRREAVGQWEAARKTMEKALRIVETVIQDRSNPHG